MNEYNEYKLDEYKFKDAENYINKAYNELENLKAGYSHLIDSYNKLLVNYEQIKSYGISTSNGGIYYKMPASEADGYKNYDERFIHRDKYDNDGLKKEFKNLEELKNKVIEIKENLKTLYPESYNWNFNEEDKIESSNFFSELTDKQYNEFGYISYYFNYFTSDFVEGKKLCEVSKYMERRNDSLFGEYLIVEVVKDEFDDASILILKDLEGNYIMVFPPTYNFNETPAGSEEKDWDQKYEDAMYDVGVYLGLTGTINERDTVIKKAKKYYLLAQSEGVTLNFYGYSKGGGMAEIAYLGVAEAFGEELNQNVLGKIVLYNPYHDNLDDSQAKILKESGDLTVYRNQGDFVSTIFNEHTFDEETIFIHCNWTEKYSISESDFGGIFVDGFFSGDLQMIISNIKNVGEIFGGAHGLGAPSPYAFDLEGNSIYNPDSYMYDPEDNGYYDKLDVSYYIMGIEDFL